MRLGAAAALPRGQSVSLFFFFPEGCFDFFRETLSNVDNEAALLAFVVHLFPNGRKYAMNTQRVCRAYAFLGYLEIALNAAAHNEKVSAYVLCEICRGG